MLLPVIQYPLKYFLDACYPIDDIPCGTQCSNPCPTHPMCVNRPTVRYSGAMTVGIDENELIVYGGVRYSPKYEVLIYVLLTYIRMIVPCVHQLL